MLAGECKMYDGASQPVDVFICNGLRIVLFSIGQP